MAAKTPKAKAAAKGAANDTGPAQAHPLFPSVDVERLAKIVVYRVAIERRKGLPGYGVANYEVLLTPDGVPSAALTSEAQIAGAFGAGHYKLVPKDASNRMLGACITCSIADDSGRVPAYVEDFENPATDEKLDAAMSPTEKLLRQELALLHDRLAEERAGYKELMADQRAAARGLIDDVRAAHRQDIEGLGKLLEQVVNANSARPGDGETWERKRVQELEDRLNKRQEEFLELAIKNAKKHPDDSSEWFGLVKEVGPMALSAWGDFKQLQEKKLKLEEERLNRRRLPAGGGGDGPPKGLVIQGVPVVSLEKLRELIAKNGTVPKEVCEVFRVFARDGMLPRAYEELLAPYLRASDGESPGATP